jgi:fructose-bisphosphate aldolase, class I
VLTIDTYYDYTQQDGGGSHSLITTVEEAVRMGVDAVK